MEEDSSHGGGLTDFLVAWLVCIICQRYWPMGRSFCIPILSCRFRRKFGAFEPHGSEYSLVSPAAAAAAAAPAVDLNTPFAVDPSTRLWLCGVFSESMENTLNHLSRTLADVRQRLVVLEQAGVREEAQRALVSDRFTALEDDIATLKTRPPPGQVAVAIEIRDELTQLQKHLQNLDSEVRLLKTSQQPADPPTDSVEVLRRSNFLEAHVQRIEERHRGATVADAGDSPGAAASRQAPIQAVDSGK
jgi:hypothetical protein